jgi:hypothetical protein
LVVAAVEGVVAVLEVAEALPVAVGLLAAVERAAPQPSLDALR